MRSQAAGISAASEPASGSVRALCRGCNAWAQTAGAFAVAVPPETIDPAFGFAFDIVPGLRLPPVCAACGRPATRLVTASHANANLGVLAATAVAGLASGNVAVAIGATATRAAVPHCEAHTAGAIMAEHQSMPVLAVQSCRFYLETAMYNADRFHPIDTSPGRSTMEPNHAEPSAVVQL